MRKKNNKIVEEEENKNEKREGLVKHQVQCEKNRLGPVQTTNFTCADWSLMRELNACEVRRLNQLNSTI